MNSKNRSLTILLLVGLLSMVLLFLRRPDALLQPQFWAEDGKYWFGEAYQYGIKSLFIPYAGSLQMTMRLTGLMSIILPFSYVPLFFTLIALVVQILPVFLINTQRFRKIFKDDVFRWSISFLYILMPNAIETHANLTNIGWHLALISFLIIIAPKTNNIYWKFFDIFLLVLGALTGPFSFMLTVVALYVTYRIRESNQIRNLIILIVGSIVQLIIVFLGAASERKTSLSSIGANESIFVQIIGKRIFGVSLLGNDISLSHVNKYLLITIFIIGCTIIIYTLLKANYRLKLFVIFCWMVLGATLISPAMGGSWLVQLQAVNDRYWLLPSLSFLICLVWVVTNKKAYTPIRALSLICLALFFFIALPRSFVYKPHPDQNFKDYSRKFTTSEPGQITCIPVNPDNGWLTCLIRH